jgi:uncharacterized membrane protein YtjA (UPF0391 family)
MLMENPSDRNVPAIDNDRPKKKFHERNQAATQGLADDAAELRCCDGVLTTSAGGGSSVTHQGRTSMLGWAITFLILALVAGFLGFFGLVGVPAGVAKILLVAFIALFAVSALSGVIRGRAPPLDPSKAQ